MEENERKYEKMKADIGFDLKSKLGDEKDLTDFTNYKEMLEALRPEMGENVGKLDELLKEAEEVEGRENSLKEMLEEKKEELERLKVSD